MDINKTHSLVAGALLCVLLFTRATCTKTSLDCANTKYSFLLPVKAYPNKGIIRVGDTIWLEINESTSFTDHQTGQIVNYSGANNLGSVIAFGRYDTILKSWTNENPDDFQRILKDQYGDLLNQTSIDVEYLFAEKEGKYVFVLGVVPKNKGLFSILFSNSNNTYRKNDRCTKANFAILFEETDQHYRLNPFYIPGTNPRGGDYYFKVI